MSITSPETRLALEHAPTVARGSVLVGGFAGAELPEALLGAGAAHVAVFVQDLRAFRATEQAGGPAVDVRYGPWPSASFLWSGTAQAPPHDAAVVLLPKAAEHLRMLLASLRPRLRTGAPVMLIGRNDAGIKAAGRHLREAVGEPQTLGYRFHCRALLAETTGETAPFEPRSWRMTFAAGEIRGCSYPGVFSHGRADPGTLLMLETLSLPPSGHVLDVGCGSGLIAAAAARSVSEKVHAVDVDATALLATGATASLNGVGDRVAAWASDVLSDVADRYTHIVSNPPFHAGTRTTHGVAIRLIDEATDRLEHRGELWIVANRFLPYGDRLEARFRTVEIVADDRRYRVWRARR